MDLSLFLCDTLGLEEYDPQKVKEKVEMITVTQSGKLNPEFKPVQTVVLV